MDTTALDISMTLVLLLLHPTRYLPLVIFYALLCSFLTGVGISGASQVL